MSTQSIKDINKNSICDKIDDFLINEGKNFIRMIDYDTDYCIDYKKIDSVIFLKNIMDRTEDCKEVLNIIDKILI